MRTNTTTTNVRYSGLVSANTLIYRGACNISAIQVFGDGTNSGCVTVYDCMDQAQASTLNLIGAYTNPGGSFFFGRDQIHPMHLQNGIYVSLTGTNVQCTIEWITKGEEIDHLRNIAVMVFKVAKDIESLLETQQPAKALTGQAVATAAGHIVSKGVI